MSRTPTVRLKITGKVLISRNTDAGFRVVVLPETGRRFIVNCSDPSQTKPRKGSTVTVTGTKVTEGYESVVLAIGNATGEGITKMELKTGHNPKR